MIPKVIHYCWLSGDPYPDLIQRCIDSWKKRLPDYELVLWDASRFDVNQTEWTRQAFEKRKWAFVADFVRFYALYNYGGIYLDSDVEVLKPFDDLLQQDYFFGFECGAAEDLPEAACFGAAKGLPWLKKCMDFYEKEPFIAPDGSFNQIVAPMVFKAAFESCENVSLRNDGKIRKLDGGSIYPDKWFSSKNRYSDKPIVTADTYAVHHFTSAWFDRRTKMRRKIVRLSVSILGEERYKRLIGKVKSVLHGKKKEN